VRGLEGGVKLLSNFNMAAGGAAAGFRDRWSGTLRHIRRVLPTLAVAYVANIVLPLSNWIGREDDTFYHGWTVFYWAWWISWSPFVGMFIARVSRGRTVREFMVAVLLCPRW
jgi:betaine/carnitine transporter, BCCT family